jgi:phosphoglycerate kinase
VSATNTIPEKLFIEDLDARGKRVLVRVDFNVPLAGEGGRMAITDDRRIVESLPTIRRLSGDGARVILMSHLGRPKGKRAPEASLEPVARRLGELLGKPIAFAADCIGEAAMSKVETLGDGDVLLLENLRFHAGEEKNDPAFAAALASLGDLYVNDAFGSAHRAHASTEGITRHMAACACGYLLRKELDYLGAALADPGRPFVAVIGGAKISTKINVLERLLDRVDTLLVGGGMAYTFFKAMGREIGGSLLEEGQEQTALGILDKAKRKRGVELLLPVDCVAAEAATAAARRQTVSTEAIPADLAGFDIGPRTSRRYAEIVAAAKTVVWNGPMGKFEEPTFAAGTRAVAEAMARATARGAVTIVGGGDSALAIQQCGLEKQVSHVSTGGGASLEFLEGKVLPGVAALTDR